MKKPLQPQNKPLAISCTAVCVVKSDSFLSEAVELTIEDGVVVNAKALTRGADVIQSSVGKASQSLWSQFQDGKNTFDAGVYRNEKDK